MKAEQETVKILHIENDVNFRLLVEFALFDCEVDYELDSVPHLDSALEIIDEIAQGQIEPYDVILLDGDISSSSHEGQDAQQILSRIRNNRLTSYVIGLSSEPLGPEVDEDLGKENALELNRIIEDFAANRNEFNHKNTS